MNYFERIYSKCLINNCMDKYMSGIFFHCFILMDIGIAYSSAFLLSLFHIFHISYIYQVVAYFWLPVDVKNIEYVIWLYQNYWRFSLCIIVTLRPRRHYKIKNILSLSMSFFDLLLYNMYFVLRITSNFKLILNYSSWGPECRIILKKLKAFNIFWCNSWKRSCCL